MHEKPMEAGTEWTLRARLQASQTLPCRPAGLRVGLWVSAGGKVTSTPAQEPLPISFTLNLELGLAFSRTERTWSGFRAQSGAQL